MEGLGFVFLCLLGAAAGWAVAPTPTSKPPCVMMEAAQIEVKTGIKLAPGMYCVRFEK